MENDMTKLFAEGGINTGDVDVDPVSGNEVPPGSLPEEVRDDVDAKLSGGEYVVPADVLRYYGVSFFEKLRKKAKEGLAEMDAEGRIGGDTAPEEGMTEGPEAEEEDDDLPFSEDELLYEEDDMEFAEGGLSPVKTLLTPTSIFRASLPLVTLLLRLLQTLKPRLTLMLKGKKSKLLLSTASLYNLSLQGICLRVNKLQ